VVVDVSGSISEKVLSQFFAEVERICHHARVDVLLWDAAFQGFFRNYRVGDWKRISLTGGGGTDMAAPVDWLVEHHAVGDCVVLLTDGICNWPAPRRFPLISVLSRPGAGPAWGRVLCLAA
jgi:predicted metal-dependent peptidase